MNLKKTETFVGTLRTAAKVYILTDCTPANFHRANVILVIGCPAGFPSEWSKTGAPRWGLGGLPGAAPYKSLSSGHSISVQTTELSEFL